MSARNRKAVFATALTLVLACLGPAGAMAEMSCISDWSEAGPIVRREGLVSMEVVDRLARDHSSLQVVRSSLCRDNDRYVYRLTVRGGGGALKTLVVDARRPFEH